jgi:hypothetical protein
LRYRDFAAGDIPPAELEAAHYRQRAATPEPERSSRYLSGHTGAVQYAPWRVFWVAARPAAPTNLRPAPSSTCFAPTGSAFDLSKRDAGNLLVATRRGWQSQAFAYRDLIGELRDAQRLRSRAVAHCRFYVAQVRPLPEDPVPLDSDEHDLSGQLAADALVNFGRIPFDHEPDGFTVRLDENLGIAGETWVHIDDEERFHVRSISEITASADGRVTPQTLPTATADTTRPIDPTREDLLRCWVPHPEWGQLADSSGAGR